MYTDHVTHYQMDAACQDYFSADPFIEQEIRRRYEAFLHHFRLKPDHHLLEIGSGGGFFLPLLEKHPAVYFPLDIAWSSLDRIARSSKMPVYPASGDGYNLPFQPDSFDAVVLLEVLEHLEKPEAALREIRRILKSSGTLFVSVPYREKIAYQLCVHCNKPTPTNAHLHVFDEEKLTELIRSTGFQPGKAGRLINKASNRLYVNRLLKWLPFSLWHRIDQLFNLMINKPASMIVVATK